VPKGTGDRQENTQKAIMIGATVLGAALTGGIGAGAGVGFWGGAWAGAKTGIAVAALNVGSSFLMSKTQSVEKADFNRLGNVTGSRNRANAYGVIPKVYGKRKIYPSIAGKPFTEVIGNEQYLRVLFCLGYGPLIPSVPKVGDTSIGDIVFNTDGGTYHFNSNDNYEDVEIEIGERPSIYANDVDEIVPGDSFVDAGDAFIETTSVDTDEFSVTLTFPSGLYREDNGKTKTAFYAFDVHYREVGETTWNDASFDLNDGLQFINCDLYPSASPLGAGFETKNAARETHRCGIRRKLPSKGQYEIRVTKKNASSSSSNDVDDCTWSSFKSVEYVSPVNTENIVYLAMRVKAQGNISNTLEQFSVEVESQLSEYNGSSWSDPTSYTNGDPNSPATSNPAWIAADIISGNANSGALAKSKIDADAFKAWADRCDTRGDECNMVVDSSTTVKDLLQEVSSYGRASIQEIDGVYLPVVDIEKTTPVQHFTPRNSINFSSTRIFPDNPHALKVRFINPDKDWQQDEAIVYDDGYNADGSGEDEQATKFETISFLGITNWDQAWKTGRYILAEAKLRQEVYSLEVDFEHLIANRGDLVKVTHDVPLWGSGYGRIKSFTLNGSSEVTEVVLDDVVTIQAATDYVLRVRGTDGSSHELSVATTSAGEYNTLSITPEVADIAAGDLYMFGEVNKETTNLKITAIQAQDDLRATLLLVDDAPEIYDADSGTIPPFDSNLTEPLDITDLTPPEPVIDDIRSDTTVLYQDSDRSRRLTLSIDFSAAKGFPSLQIEARARVNGSNGSWRIFEVTDAINGNIALTNVEQGQVYEVQIRSRNYDQVSGWVSTTHTVVGKGEAPSDVSNYSVSVDKTQIRHKWDENSDPDIGEYEIRVGGTGWSDATLVDRTKGTTLTTAIVTSGNFTYRIKAIDTSGNYSTNAVSDTVTVDDKYTDDPVYTGDDVSFNDATFEGTSTFNGDIIQSGEAYETHAEQIYTTKDFIISREGAVAAIPSGDIAGHKVLKADGTNNVVFGVDNGAIARVGWEGDTLQAIATRPDAPSDNGIAVWNATNDWYETRSGLTYNSSGLLSATSISTGAFYAGSLAEFGADIYPETNYTSNLGAANKKFLSAHIAEMYVELMTVSERRVTQGGRFNVGLGNILDTGIGTSDTSITVRYSNLNDGDVIHLEKELQVEFMRVDSASTDNGDGTYTYDVIRNLDGSGSNSWSEGDGIFNTGTTGAGFIDMYAINSLKTGVTTSGPAIAFMERTGTAYDAIEARMVSGNLKGWYGVTSDTYGMGAGNYTSGSYIRATEDGIYVKGADIDVTSLPRVSEKGRKAKFSFENSLLNQFSTSSLDYSASSLGDEPAYTRDSPSNRAVVLNNSARLTAPSYSGIEFSNTDSFMYSIWVKVDSATGVYWLMGKGNYDESYGIYYDNGTLRAGTRDASNNIITQNYNISTNTWYHVAWVYNPNESVNKQQLWINGVREDTDSTSASGSISTTEVLRFGNGTLGGTENRTGCRLAQANIYSLGGYSSAQIEELIKSLYLYPSGNSGGFISTENLVVTSNALINDLLAETATISNTLTMGAGSSLEAESGAYIMNDTYFLVDVTNLYVDSDAEQIRVGPEANPIFSADGGTGTGVFAGMKFDDTEMYVEDGSSNKIVRFGDFTAAQPSSLEVSESLIGNAGFENGSPPVTTAGTYDWIDANRIDDGGTFNRDSTYEYSGSYAVRVDGDGTYYMNKTAYQDIDVSAYRGETLMIRFRTKWVDQVGGYIQPSCLFSIIYEDEDGGFDDFDGGFIVSGLDVFAGSFLMVQKYVTVPSGSIGDEDTWHTVEVPFVVKDDASEIRIQFEGYSPQQGSTPIAPLYVDAFETITFKGQVQLGNNGLFAYESPLNYIDMTTGGGKIKSNTIEFIGIKNSNLYCVLPDGSKAELEIVTREQ
tara:strand:+ start:28789 stop:34554 length:5766 start_codon:yes stop_codon:yes gene_type:complete